MIEEVLNFIHNYFEYKKVRGAFSILNGRIDDNTLLQGGQFFKIVGSVFNDGVWQDGVDILTDETFEGEVWLMAVPPRVVQLTKEIEDWCTANKDVITSPYSSESFGGYSYTKATGNAGDSGSGAFGWQSVFGSRLNQWRKIS